MQTDELTELQRQRRIAQSPLLNKRREEEEAALEQTRSTVDVPEWSATPEQDVKKAGDGVVPIDTPQPFLPPSDADLLRRDLDLVGQQLADKQRGRKRPLGSWSPEYLKPQTRTVKGRDLATGQVIMSRGDPDNEVASRYADRSIELLRTSNNNIYDGPDGDGLRGLAYLAASVQEEGGTLEDFKRYASQYGAPEYALGMAWTAADSGGLHRDLEQAFTSEVGDDELQEIPQREPEQSFTEDELASHQPWLEAAQRIWEYENGTPYAGDPQTLNDWALNEMSNFNWRVVGDPNVNGTSMAYYGTQAYRHGGEYAQALYDLISIYDATETNLGTVGRSVGALFTDPTTYMGLSGVAKPIVKSVAKNRMVKWLEGIVGQQAAGRIVQNAAVGAVEGGVYTGVEDAIRQSVAINAGEQEEYSAAQGAAATAVGVGAGLFWGTAVGELVSPNAMNMYGATWSQMRNNLQAGPGRLTPMSRQVGAVGDLSQMKFSALMKSDTGLADEISNLRAALDLSDSKTFKNNRELKVELQKRTLDAMKNNGIDLREDTDAANKVLHDVVVKDAIEALKSNSNAIGWYDKTVSAAKRVLETIHPEFATNPEANHAFTYALAVTSNGNKVDKNFELAELAYRHWKETGKMPTDIGIGTPAVPINKAMELYNHLIDTVGWEKAAKIMDSSFTVRQLKRAGFEVGGEHQDVVVRGASILGPKVGNGFYSNLNGRFDQLTMDRWLMRTWGRMTGTLLKDRPDLVKDKTGKMSQIIRSMSKEDKKAFETDVGVKLKLGDIKSTAAAIQKASTDPGRRAKMSRTEAGDLLRRLGNGLAKDLDGSKEAPTPADRVRIRKVFNDSLTTLKRMGYNDMSMADLQALLWYPEKRVYEKSKSADDVAEGYLDEEAPDYANAAVKQARILGVDEKKIEDAVNGRTTGTRSGNGAEPKVAVEGGAGEFTPRERRKWLQREVYARNRPRRKGGRKARSFKTASGRNAGGVGGVKSVHTPTSNYAKLLSDSEILADITLHELEPSRAPDFHAAITQSKETSPYGAAVYVYPEDMYKGMRLFMTPDQKSGFAIKEDGDIVSMFSDGNGKAYPMLQLAVEQGGTKLDAFDTVLPEIYSMAGFVEVGRDKWSDEYMPENWNKEAFSEYNGGEPDVVYMEYQP